MDLVQHAFEISEHIIIPEAQNAVAGGFDLALTQCIGLLLPIMLSAIEFDDDLRLAAGEIDNERADEGLPPKMRTGQRNVMAKPLPEHALGIGGLRPHSLRKLSLAIVHRVRSKHSCHRLWTPTPAPPRKGEGAEAPSKLRAPSPSRGG